MRVERGACRYGAIAVLAWAGCTCPPGPDAAAGAGGRGTTSSAPFPSASAPLPAASAVSPPDGATEDNASPDSTAASKDETTDDPCADEVTQTFLNVCWGHAAEKADLDLSKVIARLEKKLSLRGDRTLVPRQREAQAKWKAYRDIECELHRRFYEGGSIMPMIDLNCKWAMTKRRINDVRVLIEEWSIGQ